MNTIGIAAAIIHETGGIGAGVDGILAGSYHAGYIAAAAHASLYFDDLIITSVDPSQRSVAALYSLALSYGEGKYNSIENVAKVGGGPLMTGVGITGDGRQGYGHAIAAGGWGANLAGQSFEGSLYQCQTTAPGYTPPVGQPCSASVYRQLTYDPSTTILQFAVNLPVNRFISGGMHLRAYTELSASGPDGIALASVDYGRSLKFVTGRPVFELPDGFVANSTSLNIVDNYYVGNQEVTPVPEPGSLLLVAVGAVGCIGRHISRRRAATGARDRAAV